MKDMMQFDPGFKQRIDEAIDGHGGEVRRRVWDRKTLFWSMVAQAASFNASCSFAVKSLRAAGRKCSSNTSAFCKAVARFPMGLMERILSVSAGFAEPSPSAGRRVLHIDGVSFTLADTEENRAATTFRRGRRRGAASR